MMVMWVAWGKLCGYGKNIGIFMEDMNEIWVNVSQ